LANVFLPISIQFVAVSAAAPDVVVARITSQFAVLAAPRERGRGVSTLLDVISTACEADTPLAVNAPVIVCVPEFINRSGPLIVRDEKVLDPRS
jgi:hypothetical protein